MFGGGKTQGQKQTIYNAVRIQSSTFGAAIPLIYGAARTTMNMIWYGDFYAEKHEVGGK